MTAETRTPTDTNWDETGRGGTASPPGQPGEAKKGRQEVHGSPLRLSRGRSLRNSLRRDMTAELLRQRHLEADEGWRGVSAGCREESPIGDGQREAQVGEKARGRFHNRFLFGQEPKNPNETRVNEESRPIMNGVSNSWGRNRLPINVDAGPVVFSRFSTGLREGQVSAP
jgi:hypothetical protein